ncbi:hypothetical protein HMPREF1624_06013 [Sporothrix schenckii ATCC 58251]|uniref:Amidase domain-containing protein n=1 Tax=Sporothrix schenckii (strain ATCC 58251 / de Perez 2211183) TaxID=1391915 RepID=U7PQG9_SPOS1|nr:hypothetical protein HMPREF1624_06013 [Sporothrix schenckii ATCC 58251]
MSAATSAGSAPSVPLVLARPSPANIPPLKSLTTQQVLDGLSAATFTTEQLVQAHLNQIARFDSELHAVLQINPNALNIARELDAELAGLDGPARKKKMRPLHGVPLLVKDNVATAEPALEATAGSLALLGAKPARQNLAVTRLRDAGCVLLGTTNCSEWANFRSRPSDSGWSARGGQTYGAYHAKQDPSGSSSGSAVAVDMGYCVLAVGTETSGSIISPATQNNIVGLKPTTGLVSRDAVVPISPQQDTLGPMTRTLADAALMLDVMMGRDEHDPKTAEIPEARLQSPLHPRLTAVEEEASLSLRIGIPRDALQGIKSAILEAFETRVVAPLRAREGVTIVDCTMPGLLRFKTLSLVEKTNYMAGEFHDALPAYLAALTANPQHIDGVKALCAFIKSTPEEEYGENEETDEKRDDSAGDTTEEEAENIVEEAVHDIGPPRRNIERLEQTQAVTRDSAAFAAAKTNAAYFAGAGGVQGALDGIKGGPDRPHGFNTHEPVDILLLPTNASAVNYFAACEGHPQVTLPLGYRDSPKVKRNDTGRLVATGPNVPYGVSAIARKYDEASLMRVCSVIEKQTRTREHAEERRLAHLRG